MPQADGAGAEPDRDPNEELQEILRELMNGGQGFDPAKLAGVAGLPNDPGAIQALMANMQAALSRQGDGLDWSVAETHAKRVAGDGNQEIDAASSRRYDDTFRVAELWLAEATTLGDVAALPRTMTRLEWIGASMNLWSQLTEPVATSITDALVGVLSEQTPSELADVLAQSNTMFRNLGGAMFTIQLGQVLGGLAKEVVGGGDIGVPVFAEPRAVLLPQNLAEFGDGLDVPASEVELYFAVRELAHARLFAHAKWLRLHLVSSVTAFAKGISIDVDRLEGLVHEIDPSNPESIQEALSSGAFIPPRTPEQELALARLETMLALIEGWVDEVTRAATTRLPSADAIAESVRRRRATGGPAERAFATLVGLELRPRRLREAAAMWAQVASAHGEAVRDGLWDHFDALPTSDDLDHPEVLVHRLGFGESPSDDFDRELASFLDDPSAFGAAPSGGDRPDGDAPDDRSDEGPGTPPRPAP